MHGDNPANATELGNQKNGYYFCSHCTAHKALNDDITYSFSQKIKTIEGVRKTVMSGKFGSKKSAEKEMKPFSSLSASEIFKELKFHKIVLSKGCKKTKKDLLPILKSQVLKGIQRVPLLLVNESSIPLKSINLTSYEIAMTEPMHDIAGHIENILKELPHHVSEHDKCEIEHFLQPYQSSKEVKRCCDKRKIKYFPLTDESFGGYVPPTVPPNN